MPESEEALLRRAAELVRREGREATPGPWTRAMKTRTKSAIVAPTPDDAEFYMRDREHVAICSVPHFDGGGGFARARSGRDLDWIALVGPQLAEPLAAWLEKAAQSAEIVTGTGYSVQREAIAVARALLGEPALTAPVGDDRQEGSP